MRRSPFTHFFCNPRGWTSRSRCGKVEMFLLHGTVLTPLANDCGCCCDCCGWLTTTASPASSARLRSRFRASLFRISPACRIILPSCDQPICQHIRICLSRRSSRVLGFPGKYSTSAGSRTAMAACNLSSSATILPISACVLTNEGPMALSRRVRPSRSNSTMQAQILSLSVRISLQNGISDQKRPSSCSCRPPFSLPPDCCT